jgi:hypothetical protein
VASQGFDATIVNCFPHIAPVLNVSMECGEPVPRKPCQESEQTRIHIFESVFLGGVPHLAFWLRV